MTKRRKGKRKMTRRMVKRRRTGIRRMEIRRTATRKMVKNRKFLSLKSILTIPLRVLKNSRKKLRLRRKSKSWMQRKLQHALRPA